jgi:tripartite-type tricarboxylate transporter receptor subunit TctC
MRNPSPRSWRGRDGYRFAHPPVIEKYKEFGVSAQTSTPAELAVYLKTEMAKWGAVIREANIKLE